MPFNYETYKAGDSDDVLVIKIVGRLDAASSQFLLNCIEDHVEHHMHHIVLDCTKLEHVSSMGLTTLVRADSRLTALGGSVALVQVTGLVADVIRVSQLDKRFHIFPTVSDAVSEFSRQS